MAATVLEQRIQGCRFYLLGELGGTKPLQCKPETLGKSVLPQCIEATYLHSTNIYLSIYHMPGTLLDAGEETSHSPQRWKPRQTRTVRGVQDVRAPKTCQKLL